MVERLEHVVAEDGEDVLLTPGFPVVLVVDVAVGQEDVRQPRASPVRSTILEALSRNKRALDRRIFIA